jgi:hypothetical protein
MVRVVGLEPTSLAAADFKSAKFTNFSIPALQTGAGHRIRTCNEGYPCRITNPVPSAIQPIQHF